MSSVTIHIYVVRLNAPWEKRLNLIAINHGDFRKAVFKEAEEYGPVAARERAQARNPAGTRTRQVLCLGNMVRDAVPFPRKIKHIRETFCWWMVKCGRRSAHSPSDAVGLARSVQALQLWPTKSSRQGTRRSRAAITLTARSRTAIITARQGVDVRLRVPASRGGPACARTFYVQHFYWYTFLWKITFFTIQM